MKAYMVKRAGECELCEIPVPEIKAGEALVKVKAASICHSDLDIIEGRRVHSIKLPVVLGHEFAGVVEETGSGVTGLAKGQKVACECIVWCGECRTCRNGETSCCKNFDELGTMRNGGFAEYAAVPAKMLHPVNNLTFEEASNMEPAGNGCHAAQAASIREGDIVVVVGPGPIGLYAMQFASLYNPEKLIMVGTRENRLEAARKLGATHAININECDAHKTVMELTKGKGADRVLQCATTDEAVRFAFGVMGSNSVLAIEGYGKGEPIPVDFGDFIKKPMTITGVSGVAHQNFIDAVAAAEAGKIKFEPVITHRFTLDEIEKGFAAARDRSKNAIKIVIFP
ncbi:MAG: alcohol dehydrogenase catalytic domain-containing protein [Oscillospiraceae bacterium]|nr:alcohol dehydrogenase catalytic domain-containing protein [Oscillospiraceae bacterium]